MATETILQSWIFSQFALPFLLIFFIAFGLLEKTNLFGEGKKQLNAGIAFVIGLIFVSAIYPKIVVGNLILFFTVALVVMFIGLLLWGFVTGKTPSLEGSRLRIPFMILIGIAVLAALLWALGIPGGFFRNAFDFIFQSNWSGSFWTNTVFIIVIIAAVIAVVGIGKSKSSSG